MSASQAQPLCAICGKLQVKEFKPFCSRRCADVDLHRWMAGVYSVPAVEDDDDQSSSQGDGNGPD